MKNFDQFKKDFKRELLVQIIVNMKYGKTSTAQAKTLATRINEIMQMEDSKEVFQALNKLSETNSNILDLFIKHAKEFEIKEKDERLEQIHIYLKSTYAKGGEIN
jgi:hypothetical protein